MPLTGKDKTEYQREYMRRRRAGEKPRSKTAALKARIRELEAALARERKARAKKNRDKA